MSDYFEVFGLPRKLQVDGEALQRRFYELSRQHHPDFHQLADAQEQAAALASSALVNRAYRALRDPVARVEYLVGLERTGAAAAGAVSTPAKVPASLLGEMMDVQEMLEEARTGGLDEPARARLREERQGLLDRREATEAEMAARGAEWDAALDQGRDRAPLLAWFEQALATRAYLRTVIDDLSEALGEDHASHVSHRRH